MNNVSVDSYLAEGCGRCDRFQTPDCKVHRWTAGLVALRGLLRDAGLTETMKWGQPTYTLDGKNVALIASYNDSYAVVFFKGVLLPDPEGVLDLPGPASHAGRLLRFTAADEVAARREEAARFLAEAVALERAGAQVPERPRDESVPDALQAVFDADPQVRAAFEALTPGRRRSHVLHVSGAKQASTQAARAARCVEKILAGKGFHDR